MDQAGPSGGRPKRRAPRRNWGRTFARVLCLLFACIGAIPLTGGLVLRSEWVQRWAASETSRILREQLGVEANFSVEFDFVPLRLAVTHLTVAATDGGSPALEARLTAVRPRFFSLLAGRLDVGDVELEDSSVRLVIRDGKLQNVALSLPETDPNSPTPELTRSPFRSLTITNATVDLDVEGTHLRTDAIDLDAFAEPGLAFDVALRMAGAVVDRTRPTEKDDTAHDEDRLCALELRAHLSREQITIRRFSLLGAIDLDPAQDTRPPCDTEGPERVAVRLSQLKIKPTEATLPEIRGRVFFRAPTGVVNRFAGTDLTGWAGFSGEVILDGSSRLPDVNGQISGEGLSIAGKTISKRVTGQVRITDDVIRVPRLEAEWGNGTAVVSDFKMEPFAETLPFSVAHVDSRDIDFPGVMRDVDVTQHTIVDWHYDHVSIERIQGTISPFSLEGGINAQTSNFAVYDAGFDDPAKKRMIGVERAQILSRFRANPKSLDFYDVLTTFGDSRLPVEIVSISFDTDDPINIRLKEGAMLSLADVSPIANLDIGGMAHLDLAMSGPMTDPSLDGTIRVDGLSLAGFEAGDLKEGKVHFKPLFVEFTDVIGERGDMSFRLPSAKLDFDGPATVSLSAAVESDRFVVREFFRIFHFDEDPRFAEITGEGQMRGQVRYVLGGPEDTCQSGRLEVRGNTRLNEAILLGETFSGGDADFQFEWFDMDAGLRGFRLQVPTLTLRKGSGTLFGRAEVGSGGELSGHILATRIPLARLDAFRGWFDQVDGVITGVGRLEGQLERIALSTELDVSAIQAHETRIPPSRLRVQLVPTDRPLESLSTKSHCGRPIPKPRDPAAILADESDGEFLVSGSLFEGQLVLDEISISSQKNRVLRGKAELRELDVNALASLFGADGLLPENTEGKLSGEIDLEQILMARPFDSKAHIRLTEAKFGYAGTTAQLIEGPAHFQLADQSFSTEKLALGVRTPDGKQGIVDANFALQSDQKIRGRLALRETSLGVLAAALPGVERAEGRLAAGIQLQGSVTAPEVAGFLQVEEGRVFLNGIQVPLSQLQIRIDADRSGLRISQGQGQWGGGEIRLTGGAPLTGGKLGTTRVRLLAQNVSLPLDDQIRVGFDADLEFLLPAFQENSKALPRLSGNVDLLNASYERPMSMTADIASLTGRGSKTEVDSFNAGPDSLEIDVVLRSRRPLTVKNSLIEAALEIDPGGLRISGTDQRLGAVGNVEVSPGGRVFLRRNAFEVKGGLVRFNDPTRFRPEVDVSASTEYRRFEDRGATAASVSTAGTTGNAGNWRILLRAYGPPDDLRVDLTSDPPLAQDDIFLLLTVGLTRTELDQTRSAGVGSSVALEALGSLSGAESAVTDTVPIDEFRFGSTYSARSGSTEPTVTIGKRLSDRIRASVTTSLSGSNEVRSNIEYRATKRLSVEGSYDNAQRAGAPAIGNLGGDIRWRLEFD